MGAWGIFFYLPWAADHPGWEIKLNDKKSGFTSDRIHNKGGTP